MAMRWWLGKAVACAAVAVCAQVGTAQAQIADSWTGFYLGGSLGYRASDVTGTTTREDQNFIGPITQNNLTGCISGASGPCSPSKSYDNSTWRIGPYAGYTFQIAPAWIAGIEADWNWASKTSTTVGSPYPLLFVNFANANYSFSVKTGWDASLRGRVGYLMSPSTMLYGTAGVAWMKVDATSTCSTSTTSICQPGEFTPADITNSKVLTGWTIGAGVEGKLAGNWVARGEYRYSDFGTFNATDTRTCSPTPSALCGTAT